MKSPGPSETELHLSVANALDWLLLPPAFYSTFPAGWGVLSPSMAQRLRKSGLKPGMPDVMVFYEGRCFGIELKARGNTLTRAQHETHDKLRCAGVSVYVCTSLESVMSALRVEDVPVRRVRADTWQRNCKNVQLGGISAERGADAEPGDSDGREAI